MSVVEFRDVVVTYDGYPALAGATATVESGQIVLVRGENGAGKSTLLRTIAGLIPIERGVAKVLGVDVTTDRQSVRRRRTRQDATRSRFEHLARVTAVGGSASTCGARIARGAPRGAVVAR